MADFVVGDFEYRSTKMNAMTQMKVARRLAPTLKAFSSFRASDMAVKNEGEDGSEDGSVKDAVARMIETMADAIGHLDDEATDYIVANCLSLCTRRRVDGAGGTFGPAVWNKTANVLQFADLEMRDIIQIVVAVLKEALGRFFPASPSLSRTG